MNRDPLHQKITDALRGDLDGNTFERCAQSLLGDIYPNLSPVIGGSDDGMDGSFGSDEGAFPLISTVKSDVIGNFRQNITTFLDKRKGPKRAVIATTQILSGPKRRNLHKEAAKLGVTIVNIHDGAYFADRLYRNAAWRLELLGVTGNPPALSKLPRLGRFAPPDFLIGREDDLAWLRQASGDCLLVGHPGSGKTYLHQHLANEGLCLFAVDSSLERIADAIRDQQPAIIVVDDAHINLSLVQDLIRLRAELGATFRIHANCWPRQEQKVQRVVGLGAGAHRHLDLLRTKQIAELINACGIKGPDWLLHLLIHQADGKPGLAVILSEVCKTQNVDGIWSGEEAAKQILGNARVVQNVKDRTILAAFAVGGDAGTSFSFVAQILAIPEIELRQAITDLASGGVIEEVGEDRLQVRPPIIRPVLVKEAFYQGAASLSIVPLLDGMKWPAATASVLMAARQRGAQVPQRLLEVLVKAGDTRENWEHFAWVDSECATAVLDKFPERVSQAAPGLLYHASTRTLHALLDADDGKSDHSGSVDHPRRRIGDWIFSIEQRSDVTGERRAEFLGVLEQRIKEGRPMPGPLLAWSLSEILNATFDDTRTAPGDHSRFHMIRGVVPTLALEHIAVLWPRIRELLRHLPPADARSLFNRIQHWFLPQHLTLHAKLDRKTLSFVRDHGRQMLADILALPQCNRAWRSWAVTKSRWGGLGLKVAVDPTYDALYGDRGTPSNWQKVEEERVQKLRAKADKLMKLEPEEALQYLLTIQAEAAEFGDQKGTGFLWVIYHRYLPPTA